ncbi:MULTISPECIES: hypothetical protein [Vibrio harveyi group]|uniref:hypothetical protein n=1 Tax=Vibrio harveyi group TaxID=717610 RepID=UPI002ED59064|nr:hypothetical protein V1M48_04845 [Vibrio harveyi]
MTSKIHKILILDGVEDYLTDLAKKYKRNLMSVGFMLVCIYIIDKQGIDIELTSAFGFAFKGDNEKVGIGLELLASFLSLICLYEIVMLMIYKKQCDSHYFGKQLTRNNKDGESENLEYLKREIDIISHHESIKQDVSDLVSKYLKEAEHRDLLLERIESPHEFERKCSESLENIISQHHERNKSYVCNVVGEIDFHIKQQRVRCFTELNESQKAYFEETLTRSILRNQVAPKTTYEHINSEFFSRYTNLFDGQKRLIDANEEWKIYIEHQIQKSIHTHEELIKKLESFSTPRKLIVIMEVYLPILWGLISIALGLLVAFGRS